MSGADRMLDMIERGLDWAGDRLPGVPEPLIPACEWLEDHIVGVTATLSVTYTLIALGTALALAQDGVL